MIRLSDAIEDLRKELTLAKDKGTDANVRFNLGTIELNLEVIAENETSANAKINWWIFGGGMDAKLKNASKHTMKIVLEPVDEEGNPIKVSTNYTTRPD